MTMPNTTPPIIREATAADVPALGRLGAVLMRTHYDFDRLRFMSPGENPDAGYAEFLATQIHRSDVVIVVADIEGEIAGYAYAGIEPLSWKELRDEAGFIHDVVVDEQSRGAGIATGLVDAAVAWLRARGVARVILWTAESNITAQDLFSRLGFRRTMVEMTLEL